MVIIESPVKGYTGISAGVGFALGKALVKELTPTQANYFKKKGYVITEENSKNVELQEKVKSIDTDEETNVLNTVEMPSTNNMQSISDID